MAGPTNRRYTISVRGGTYRRLREVAPHDVGPLVSRLCDEALDDSVIAREIVERIRAAASSAN